MSDIREPIDIWYSRNPQHEINLDTGKDMFYQTMDLCMREYAAQFISRWQSFEEAKPEVGWAIVVREYPYEPFVERYNPASLEARIFYKYQWLRIPDSNAPTKDCQWAVVETNESVTFHHKELAIEYRDACAKKFPDKHFSVIQIQ